MTDLVVRTPDDRFANLPAFPYEARYVEIEDREVGPLRMSYVDEGPRDAEPVLLAHGQPTWSFLYRKMIPTLVERGLRAIAVDNVGYGRSDKITDPFCYSIELQAERMARFVEALDLRRTTLFCQDWGGPIGFGAVHAHPDRFARIVAGNTILQTFDAALKDVLSWPQYPIDGGERVVLQTAQVEWARMLYLHREVRPSDSVAGISVAGLTPEEIAAYDAPFPEEIYRAGLRQTNMFIPLTPNDPTIITSKRFWETLDKWDRPFLTVWGAGDVATAGWEQVFQERVPGAKGQPHTILDDCNHFMQEDQGPAIATTIADFVDANPSRP